MTYRVIQWATGAMGKTCLRAVIDHPDLELVGLYVYSDKKAGADAGDIARRPPTGVKATRSVDEILALDADVVLHCPLLQFPYDAHDADVRRLLESGKNVISINNYFHPTALAPETARALEESCRKGGATLCGTGLNPGFMAERIAPILTGMCTEFESLSIREVYDCFEMPNANYVRDVMGMGLPPEKVDLKNGAFAKLFFSMYSQCVTGLADRLGLKLDSIVPDHALVLAPEDIAAPSGTMAWRRLLSDIVRPRVANISRMRSAMSCCICNFTPITDAMASRVRSSCVGPRPPQMMTASASASARCKTASTRARLSPTFICSNESKPCAASCSPIHDELVSTI